MELHELHVLQRQAGAQHHGVAVAGAAMRAGAPEVCPSVSAGGQDRLLGSETMHRAVLEAKGDDTDAATAIVHHQVEGKVLDEKGGALVEGLPIERVKHGVPGPIGGGAAAPHWRALAIFGVVPAERALVDLAVLRARERHAVVLELVDRLRGPAAHVFDRVLIAQPVGALDGVVHVPAPVVRSPVAQRGGDAPLCCNGMRSRWKHLADAGGAQSRLHAPQRGPEAGAAGADNHHIEGVIGEGIGGTIELRRGVDGVCRARHGKHLTMAPLCTGGASRKECAAR